MQLRGKLEFSGLTLDLDRRMLFRGNEMVPLRRQSLDLLAYLVERAGQTVPRPALMRAVWVTPPADPDASLSQCIKDVRAAIGENARELIRTVPRIGYQFSGEIRRTTAHLSQPESPPPARWIRHPAFWLGGAAAIGLVVAATLSFRSPSAQPLADADAIRESFRQLGPGKIGTGDKVTLKTGDGRTIHCEGGDLNIKMPRKCWWGDTGTAAR